MSLQNSFIKRYPEFKDADLNKSAFLLEDAKAEISEKQWGATVWTWRNGISCSLAQNKF